jgi:glucuronosyltransferase
LKWHFLFIHLIAANPQTKLFVSHCGINSVIEAVHYAVPLLCVPFLADQFYTSEVLARRNVAIVVDKDNLGGLVDKMKETLTFR